MGGRISVLAVAMLWCVAAIGQVDLALQIMPDEDGPFQSGDLVEYTITVHNQGSVDVQNVKVVDYIPGGLLFKQANNPGWSQSNQKSITTIPGVISAGSTRTISIYLEVNVFGEPKDMWNYAEIIYMQDTNGNDISMDDIDSTPDLIKTNDAGAKPFGETDDMIDGQNNQDEDDHDVALLIICTEMTCNDQVNISLNVACDLQLQADMILENQDYPNGAYTIISIDENGDTIPNNLINGTHLGQNLEVSVFLPGCEGWACWGFALIEDKIAIDLFCGTDTTTCTATHPDSVGFPIADNIECDKVDENTYLVSGQNGCSDILLTFEDEVIPINCQLGSPFISLIERFWQAVDGEGNVASCTSFIYVLKGDLSSVTPPPNYQNNPIACDSVILLPNGNPDPDFTGYPSGTECSNIIVVYEDLRIDGNCAGRFDVLREWTVVDWCNGDDTTFTQIIKVMDTESPICNVQDTIYSGTLADYCGGPVDVPHPDVMDNCSETSYYIGYKEYDPNVDPLTFLSQDGITGNDDIGYNIDILPVGLYYLVYFVSDDCGNKSTCVSILKVHDTSVPIAVCKTEWTVVLDQNGEGVIVAESLDDGSFDNCDVFDFKIARMNTGCGFYGGYFYDQIGVCCEDVGNETMVILRVYDSKGNYNDCMINVKVIDNIVPTIYCPPDATITCSEYVVDPYLEYLGTPVTNDNCPVTVDHYDVHALTDCGVGVIVRTWTAIDKAGNEATCKQYIEVESDYQYEPDDIIFPNDTTVVGCPYDGSGFDPSETGVPIVPDIICADFGVDYNDTIIGQGGQSCYLVKRTWKVTDFCAVNNNQNTFTHDQYIGVDDIESPVFTNCEDVVVLAGLDDCEEYVNVTKFAEDNCTSDFKIKYSYTIDFNSNGGVDSNGIGNQIIGTLPTGKHHVVMTAIDECGNAEQCEFILHVKDEKAPTPICLPISVSLGQDGEVEVWANDLDLYSFDNCHPSDLLRFSFSEDVNDNFVIYNCDSLENGVIQQFEVQMYVWDEDDNYDYCTTYIKVTDALDVCPDLGMISASISGKIMNNADHKDFEDVMVKVKEEDMGEQMFYSDEEGSFSFSDLPYFKNYSVEPFKNDDALAGVTTLDILKIQKHILDLEELVLPEQLIAADIDKSKKVSGSDIIQLRKLILGLYPDDQFPKNTSWRFYPSDFPLSTNYPYDFPEIKEVNNLEFDVDSIMFYGIKVGDVNQSLTFGLNDDDISTRATPVEFIVQPGSLKSGTIDYVHFSVDEDLNLEGLQLALEYNSEYIDVLSVQSSDMKLTSQNYSIKDDIISLSWHDVNHISFAEGQYILSVQVKVLEDCNVNDIEFSIREDYLISECIQTTEISSIELRNPEASFESEGMEDQLVQNNPNPFRNQTAVQFSVGSRGPVLMSMFSSDGKIIHQEQKNYKAGEHELIMTDKWFGADGIYYLRMQTGLGAKMIKLIKIN